MAVDATFLAIATLLVAPATALHFPICHRANLRASTLATNLRASTLHACAADADNSVSLELLEAQLKEAVAREDYKAAAELKVKIDESPANVERMYAALQKRTSQLLTRRDMMVTERRHLKDLATKGEVAQQALWDHWFGEYGDSARDQLLAAMEEGAELTNIMEEYADWVEPQNRLATLRFLEGDYAGSVELCLKILRQKPWHFGAASGIVMCYAKLGDMEQARVWAEEAMPQLGPKRDAWCERMVKAMDERLAELDEISSKA